MLRKSFAALLQDGGADIKDVGRAMGHEDTAVTKRNYTDVTVNSIQNREIERLKELSAKLPKFDYNKETE